MARRMTVDFYKVETPHGSPPFEESVRDIGRSPQDESRNLAARDGQFVRLQSYRSVRGRAEVDMLRIRMDEVPQKATLSGGLGSLELADDEGLGEETAFLYDPDTCLLALQRNRNSVSASALALYVAEKSDLRKPYVFLPLIDPNVMARVQRLKDVRKFCIRVAGSENSELLGDAATEYGFTRLNHVMDNFQAPSVEVTLSMGRGNRGGSIDVRRTKGFIERITGLFGMGPSPIEKIQVNGHDEDGASAFIDLLKYRVFEEVRLQGEDGRNIRYEVRRDAIRQAIRDRREDLERILG